MNKKYIILGLVIAGFVGAVYFYNKNKKKIKQ